MEGRSFRIGMVLLTALVVASVYALPLILVYSRHGALMHVSVVEDAYYGLRVVDASRDGSLGNPYLLEHQDAVRYLPELAERVIGEVATVSGIPVLNVLAMSRIVFPVAIFLLTLQLALNLGLEWRWAVVAAVLPPLAPSVGHL